MLRKKIAIDLGTPKSTYLLPNTTCSRRKSVSSGQEAVGDITCGLNKK